MVVFSKIFATSDPNMWLFEDTLTTPVVIGAAVACFVSFLLFKKLSGDVSVPVRDTYKNHNWTPIKVTSRSWYCSICESFLIHGIGVYCDCCGVCADNECVKKANQTLQCKVVTSNSDEQKHHWVKGQILNLHWCRKYKYVGIKTFSGNLPLSAVCVICEEDCSLEPGLIDFQCCWCQRTVHTECLKELGDNCDFGPYKNMIVPPWCVQVARRKGALHKHLLLRGVKDPGWEKWTPLVVVANKKSGNGDGSLVLSEFRKFLNPVQVIDLSSRSPPAALQICVLLAPKVVNLLVGGGDGTIAWVLTCSHKLDLDPEPPIAILPLGTGNDLSRVLGWGKENSPEMDVSQILKNIQKAKLSELDRWKIEVSPTRHLRLRNLPVPNKTYYMYNYMSIGVDAQVALNFHKTRQSAFYVYGSRVFNKLLYLCFGTHQVVTSDCKNLEKKLELYLDGKQVDLPELESIVILNISSWGAGVDLWDGEEQSHHDGILEVVGIYSSFHIAQLQVGLSNALRLGQAKSIEINLKENAPVQVDGEPWEQNPGILKVSFINRCPVLINKD